MQNILSTFIFTIIVLQTGSAVASDFENCEFKAKIVSVENLQTLNVAGETLKFRSLVPLTRVATFLITEAKTLPGSYVNCAQTYLNTERKLVLKETDLNPALINATVELKLEFSSGLYPEGPRSSTLWTLVK